jgi:tRNA (guanine37-N1)-methyltransferase
LRIDLFTLFPEAFDWFLGQRHVANALAAGNEARLFDYRATTPLGAGQVDDSPYGGGAGMLLRVDVERPGRIVLLSPAGRQFDDALANELAAEASIALLSGRYEGVDERVREHLATDAVSVGPYVLAGGELAAMIVADAVLRKVPGALGHADSVVEESFSAALDGGLEYPHYTRPASYRGWDVPEVLRSGDHARVREWRLERSRERE